MEFGSDLLKIELKPLMDEINELSKERENCFGCLPLMASSSKCQPGALNAQSFSERIKSVANPMTTKNRLHLEPELMDKLVTLRMNKRFIATVRDTKHKGKIITIPIISKVFPLYNIFSKFVKDCIF